MKLRILVFAMLIFAGICSPVWAIYCPNCGGEAPDGSKFCAQCGKALPEVSQSVKEIPPVSTTVATSSYPIIVTTPTPQAFQVTSHYLLVGGYRIYQNSFFWIAEISGSRARIWSVNEPPYNELIMGWVSLSELEKRTTLKPGTGIYCVEPPPPSAKIVVIEHRSYWQRWGFFSGSRRGHSRHDGDHRRH
ncbi:MAG: zinc ribbon domain-containing protein [Candidatus Riflebacteria bacterium]|nr:zinc ribbon domain-containing protein [Candidatus Riflebacteria bacterium]